VAHKNLYLYYLLVITKGYLLEQMEKVNRGELANPDSYGKQPAKWSRDIVYTLLCLV